MKEKLYSLLDKLMNIIVISLVLIIGSLPIITMLPTFSAVLGTIHFFNKKGEWESYPAAFKYYFKKYFKQSFLCQLLLMFVFVIGRINLSLLETLPSALKLMVYSITLFFSCLVLLIIFNNVFSFLVYPEKMFLERLKMSLLMTIIKLPYSLLLLMMIMVGSIFIFWLPSTIIIILGSLFMLYGLIEKKIWKEFLYQGK